MNVSIQVPEKPIYMRLDLSNASFKEISIHLYQVLGFVYKDDVLTSILTHDGDIEEIEMREGVTFFEGLTPFRLEEESAAEGLDSDRVDYVITESDVPLDAETVAREAQVSIQYVLEYVPHLIDCGYVKTDAEGRFIAVPF